MSVFIDLFKFRATLHLFLSMLSVIAFSSVVIILLNFLNYVKRRVKYNRVLPGLNVSPFNLLGNIHVIPLREASRNGYSIQAFALQVINGLYQIFRNRDLFCVWVSYHPLVCVVKPEAVEMVLKDSTLLDKSWMYEFMSPLFGEGLVTSTSYKWKARRKLLNPCLHLDILKEFLPIFNEQARKLVRNLQNESDGKIIDLFKPISNCVLDITCETILGVEVGAQDNKNAEYVQALESIGSCIMERTVSWWTWPDFVFRFTKCGKNLKRSVKIAQYFTNNVIQQKKEEYLSQGGDLRKRKALMDLLLEHHMERQTFSEEDIREEVDTFTAAAGDTTSIAIYFALYFLGQHKDIQAKVCQELEGIFGEDTERRVEKEDLKDMKYMECVIKETLRLHPSVPIFGRNALEEKNICGYEIPKGATIVVSPYVLHRNPDVFPDPEKFDPTRFLPENSANRHTCAYVPFAAGPRNCIGQNFAMFGMKVILSTVLRHFSVMESRPPRDKLVPTAEITLRTSEPLGFLLERL